MRPVRKRPIQAIVYGTRHRARLSEHRQVPETQGQDTLEDSSLSVQCRVPRDSARVVIRRSPPRYVPAGLRPQTKNDSFAFHYRGFSGRMKHRKDRCPAAGTDPQHHPTDDSTESYRTNTHGSISAYGIRLRRPAVLLVFQENRCLHLPHPE